MGDRTLKESLARFMDPQAFEPVPKKVGKARSEAIHDSRKVRREIAAKRADAAIRFFCKPDSRAQLDARIARTTPQTKETGDVG